jgi:hypothetical protein
MTYMAPRYWPADISGSSHYITIANGNWNNPAIWQGGHVPDADAQVTVRHAVAVVPMPIAIRCIVEQTGGNLTVNAGVTLDILH